MTLACVKMTFEPKFLLFGPPQRKPQERKATAAALKVVRFSLPTRLALSRIGDCLELYCLRARANPHARHPTQRQYDQIGRIFRSSWY